MVKIRVATENDIQEMARLGNNPSVAANLRDGFPSPYTENDSRKFILDAKKEQPIKRFAIEFNGSYVGNIGLHPMDDIYRKTAELGYFIGEEYWGKGIATDAIRLMVDYGFNQLELNRIEAGVFQNNAASMRVLEKNGFEFEGIARKVAVKNGVVLDEHRYAIIHPDLG